MEKRLSPSPRIAIYSQDGLGLGHMRRNSAIAWQIFQLRPDAVVLTISDSQLGQFFRITPNNDYLKLPSIVKAGPGDWQAPKLPIPFEEVLEMRKQLIRSALLSFAPSLLLVDHMPHGAMGDLLPALDAIRAAGLPTQAILGLRDILDAPEVIERRWQEEGAFDAVEKYYSRVLVYGMREVFNLEEKYHFPESISDLMRYTGYVGYQTGPDLGNRVRARYLAGSPAGTRLIVAMAGGGADAYPMMSNLLDALPTVLKDKRSVLTMITGPFMPVELIADLHKRAKRFPVRVMESVEDTHNFISAADLVISMAGYNTSVEILRSKKPAIIIPRAGPSAEQRMRTRLFAERQWVDMIDPDDLTPEVMAEKILARMGKPVCLHILNRPALHGVNVAANQILAMLPVPEPEPIEML